nr:hypothetical protein [Oculatellaceae cyanobacterium Prado106]
MTNPQHSEPEPEQPTRRRLALLRATFIAGGVVLVGAIAALWYVQRFIQTDLAPLIARNLSQTLNRPVEVGEVEGFTLGGLRLGDSSVPPTATDSDQVEAEAIEVQFNVLELILNRTLRLNVTLIRPQIYVDQTADGRWVTTEIQQQDTEGFITTELNRIAVESGQLTLAAYPRPGEPRAGTAGLASGRSQPTPANPSATKSPSPADTKPATTSNPTPTTQGQTQTRPSAASTPSNTNDEADANAAANGEADSPQRIAPPTPRVLTTVTVQDVDGFTTLKNDNQQIRFDFRGKPETGGNLRVQGDVDRTQDSTRLTVEAADLLAPAVSVVVPLPLTLLAGRASGRLDIELVEEGTPLVNGTVRFRNGATRIAAIPSTFNRVSGGLRFQGRQISFLDVQGRYGEIPAQLTGQLDTERGYNLAARVASVSAADLLKTFDLETPVPVAGQFRGQLRVTGAIDRPLVTGTATNLRTAQVDRLPITRADTRFTLNAQSLTFNEIRATPVTGGQVVGRGVVQFGDEATGRPGGVVFDFRGQDLPGDAIARTYDTNPAITLGNLSGTAQVFGSFDRIQTLVRWQAPQATYPGRGTLLVAGDTLRFTDTALLVSGGLVKGEGILRQGRWQATAEASGIQLNQYNPELRGLLSGDFRLAGSLDDFSVAGIQAEGNARLSEGIAIINDPITASVRWLGDRLQINQATAPGFSANGLVFAQLEGTPSITNLDLNVQLRDYDVNQLPIPQTQQIQLRGTTDFTGRLTGTPDAVRVAGQLGLNQAAVNQIAFEPRLTGTFQYQANQSTALDVRGDRDRISLNLDGANRPREFLVQQGDAIARGRGQGDQLFTEVERFPIASLNFAPATAYGLGA